LRFFRRLFGWFRRGGSETPQEPRPSHDHEPRVPSVPPDRSSVDLDTLTAREPAVPPPTPSDFRGRSDLAFARRPDERPDEASSDAELHSLLPPQPIPVAVLDAGDAELELDDFSASSFEEPPWGFVPPPGGSSVADDALATRDVRTSWLQPALAADALLRLREARTKVAARLFDEPVDVVWPVAGSSPGTYGVPHSSRGFPPTSSGSARTLAELDGPEVAAVDALDRLELARLVALAVEALHANDVVTTGVRAERFAFRLDPRPAISVLDGDRLRCLGGEVLGTPGDASRIDSLDTDRRELADLVVRLLTVEDELTAGLSPRQQVRLDRLRDRAAGPVGTMPRAAEWAAVLTA